MQILTDKDLASGLEDGFTLAALQPAGSATPPVGLQICVVVRTVPDAAAGHFVLIRSTPQARVVLGCTAGSDGRPLEWLELWVQNTQFLDGADPAFAATATNAAWDVRWRELSEAMQQGGAHAVVTTPLERGHLLPAVLSVEEGRFVPLTESRRGRALALCVDDRLLEDAGLPGYTASAHRYLYTPGGDPAEMQFVRLQSASPRSDRTVDLDATLPAATGATTLGLGGPAVIVRRFAPLSVEDFSDVVSGRAWKGMENGKKIFRVPGVYRLLEDEDAMRCGNAHLFSSAQGRSGRLGEALYLKLQVFSQLCRLVRGAVRTGQLPLLNIGADSFAVRLNASGFGLPFLWTSEADLVKPGQAFALPLRNTTMRYFQGIEPLTASVYRPGFVGIARKGTANVRIRKVFPPTEEGIAVEGTIRSAERLSNDENDLLSIHLPLAEGNIDLLGHIDFMEARSEGEAVFRTFPQAFSDGLAGALRSAEGSAFSQLNFNILSPLSTPFDMYSLGVVALRLLLAAEASRLPDVLDRAFSLAHEVVNHPGGGRLEDRIAEAFAGDGRWQETLGYQHALHSTAEPTAGDASLPPRLWWATLGFVLRLFPKLLPESFCKGYGDAPPLALETIFDAPIQELDGLLLRWRAFLLGDWRQNQEVSRVIGSISDKL